MQCIILAGGLGLRMRPMTASLPKALLPVNGHPFLKHQLDWISKHGVTEVVLCVAYQGQKIRDYAKDGSAWGLKIRYVDEGEELRGTAGAIRLALDEDVLDEEFLVLYGDSFLPIDFDSVFKTFQKRTEPALMTVIGNDDRWDKSNACFDGKKVTLYQKGLQPKPKEMRYVDYGLCAFRRNIFEGVPAEGRADLADLLHQLSVRNDLAGFEVKKRFFEIGSPEGLADLSAYLHGNLFDL